MKHVKKATGIFLVAAVFAFATAACDTDDLLEVNDPDLVTPENVQGEKGASLFWAGALGQFADAYSSGGGGQAAYVGMFTDEFHLSGTFPTRFVVDLREIEDNNGTMTGEYRSLHQARVATENAAGILAAVDESDPRIAEMQALAGFTYVFFGENYCGKVPYGTTASTGATEQGSPVGTTETFNRAMGHFDDALTNTGGDTDLEYLARVGRARVLLNLGQYQAAADEVASVPTDWAYLIRSKGGSTFGQRNAIYELNSSQRRWSLSDMEGGNGIAWRSETDPRVPWFHTEGAVGFDESTPLYEQTKFAAWEDDTPLANGIEARLIEAEAELAAGNAAGAFQILNDLRATMDMDPVADPGTADGRVDVLFEERARWLFATAHRLGDLRRLIRQYGRTEDGVFPTGAFFKGGDYGNDVSFPIPFVELENRNFEAEPDGSTCDNTVA